MFNRTKSKRNVFVYLLMALMILVTLPVMAFAATPSDIGSHWAKAQITDWVNRGLVNGYPDGTFRPNRDISRAEFMALVNGAFGYHGTAANNYPDVPAGAWYADTVSTAKAAGYIAGYSDGTVKAGNPITRQEVATVIMKIKNLTSNTAAANQFSDVVQIPNWSLGAIGAVASAKIMGGYPDGDFKAVNFITRAEAVSSLDRALNYAAGSPIVTPPPTSTLPGGGSNSGGDRGDESTVVMNAIEDATVVVGATTTKTVTTVPASTTITAVSDNTEAATVSVTDQTISITGVSEGTAKISVKASRSDYNSRTRTFTVTVISVDEGLTAAKTAEALLDAEDYVDYAAVIAALALPEATNAEKIAKTAAINAAIDELVTIASVEANLAAAIAAEALLDAEDYVDYGAVTAALALPETSYAEMIAKTTAINAAIDLLVFAGQAALDAAIAAEALLVAANYVDYSEVTAALTLPETTNAEVVSKTTAINAAIDALVFAGQAALDAAIAAEALLVATDYVDYSEVTAALALPETTNGEVVAKTAAINDAIAGLVTIVSVEANLAAAIAAEALLEPTDYVDYSAVTAALALPEATYAEMIAKTTAINAAIAALVLV